MRGGNHFSTLMGVVALFATSTCLVRGERSSDECADPEAYSTLAADYGVLKAQLGEVKGKALKFEEELEACMNNAVPVEAMDEMKLSLQTMTSKIDELENENSNLKKERSSLTTKIDEANLKMKKYRDDVLELGKQISQKDEELKVHLSKPEYLFSTEQFISGATRLIEFGGELYELGHHFVIVCGLDNIGLRLMEAKVVVITKLEPHLLPIQPYWTKIKIFVGEMKTKGTQIYTFHIEPLLKKGAELGKSHLSDLKEKMGDMIQRINNGVTVMAKPIFVARPSLKSYFPESAMDRIFFFLYVIIVTILAVNMGLIFVVRPLLWCRRCVCCCRGGKCRGKKQNRNSGPPQYTGTSGGAGSQRHRTATGGNKKGK
eukprot:GHVN01081011.1.p1 GENE.GHVN01081011.1~~GHVN01081011.1.p1  ORF type:complete len:374 (+),score=66.50 GHVN01081011.1:251-1372(+)